MTYESHASRSKQVPVSRRRRMSNAFARVAVLAAPYGQLRPLQDSVPLGSIIVAYGSGGIEALASVLSVANAVPWCPVCVVLRGSESRQEPAIRQLLAARSVGCVRQEESRELASPSDIVAAIDARGPPDGRLLARNVAERLGRPDDARWLEYCFAGSLPARSRPREPVSDDTLRRRLREIPPATLSRRDWTALGDCVRALQHSRANRGFSLLRAAADCGMDVRTLRERVARLTGQSLASALALAGWEWTPEATLREWGYLEAPAERVKLRGGSALSWP